MTVNKNIEQIKNAHPLPVCILLTIVGRETLIKAFPAPNLRCEAAKPLQIRAHPPEVLRKH
jgi:hypothetical protein